MTVDFSISNNLTMINRLIIVLGRKFCLSHSPNVRKGGLLGLAAVMVGFKNGSITEPPPEIVEEVVRPILTCLLDSDPRVRYYACESLYNVTKVSKANILPLFESIFDNLSKVVSDPDAGVRSGAEVLDRLLKDIVVEQQGLDTKTFVPKLEEYIYTKNPFTRMFIISWIRLLDAKIDMTYHLPQLLDGIFTCLCDSTEEIRASTLNLLSEFLNKIVMAPTDKISIPSLINILLKHAKNDQEDVVQYTAIAWLRQLTSHMDNQDLINYLPGILSTILPCLALQSTPDNSAASTKENITTSPTKQRLMTQVVSRGNICQISSLVNGSLVEQVTIVLRERRNSLGSDTSFSDLDCVLDTLVKELHKQEHPVIKLAILDWLKKLKNADPDLILSSNLQQKLLHILLETLSARSDAVVKNALRVIADIFCFDSTDDQQVAVADHEDISTPTRDEESVEVEKRKPSAKTQTSLQKGTSGSTKRVAIATSDTQAIQQGTANITRFVQALCKTFQDKENMFEERGTFIVLNLCSIVKPEVVYRSFAEILQDEKIDLRFAYNLVQKLNQILLTTQPLFGLRSRLANDDDQEMTSLFQSLYHAWCHSSIAALTLCLLTNNHRHASEIVTSLSQLDMNLDVLTQIDWLVQLIESPVFVSLRLKLLDVNNNQYLVQSLYGLLMILPQSEAYRRLANRLSQVHKFISSQLHLRSVATTPTVHKAPKNPIRNHPLNLEPLMRHFLNLQAQHARLSRNSENDD